MSTTHTRASLVAPRSWFSIVTDLVLIVGLVALLPQTLGFSDAAQRFPLWTIYVAVALLVLDIAMELLPPVRRALAFLETEVGAPSGLANTDDDSEDDPADGTNRLRKASLVQALAWLIALGVGMYLVGYMITAPIFLLLFFVWARVPWKVTLVVTVLMTAVLYFGFYEFLRLR